MIEQIKKHMGYAYDHMRTVIVSHDNVKRVALAEMELENAMKALLELEKQMADEAPEKKEEKPDGQTD